MTRSQMKKVMDYNMKTASGIVTRRVATGIVEETVGDSFEVGYDEKKEMIKTPIKNMGKDLCFISSNKMSQIHFGVQCGQVAKSTRFIDALTRRVVFSTSSIMPIAVLVDEQVERVVQEIRFEKALEQKPTKQTMMHISPSQSISMSFESEPHLPIPSARTALGASDGEKTKKPKERQQRASQNSLIRQDPPAKSSKRSDKGTEAHS